MFLVSNHSSYTVIPCPDTESRYEREVRKIC